jgi:exopolysaccharide biosynthesis protein
MLRPRTKRDKINLQQVSIRAKRRDDGMRRIKKLVGLVLVGAIVVLVGTLALRSLQSMAQSSSQPSSQPISQSTSQSALQAQSTVQPSPSVVYTTYDLGKSLVHTITVASGFAVELALDSSTATLEQFVAQHRPIAALNGGFFDPQNQQSTSYVIQQRQVVADPRQNARLMENPDLTAYLDKILDRSEFRRYRCGDEPTDIQYGIARHHEVVPAGCQLLDSLGAGPQLLPELTLEQEGFTATDTNGSLIRDALGSRQPNARTAIGILPDGSLLWVMAAQKPDMAASGLSLPELAAFMQAQGAEAALNLDGGSSSALSYDGQIQYGKLDANGKPVVRPVKSVLLVKPV